MESRPSRLLSILMDTPFTFVSLQMLIEQNQPLSLSAALEYIRQTADALAYFHHKGIVHCDISAENLLIIDNQVKIIEFSIANLEISDGIAAGNPPYMSPEAITGAKPAPARDVWALGVTLVYLLSGQYHFGNLDSSGAESVPVLFKRILQSPPSIPASHLPPKLIKLIEQMLEKNPNERIGDMGLVASEIDAILRTVD